MEQTAVFRKGENGVAIMRNQGEEETPAHWRYFSISRDDGHTWPVAKTVHPGPCAYSCLVALQDRSIGLLYEGSDSDRYGEIRFARFSLDWLTSTA